MILYLLIYICGYNQHHPPSLHTVCISLSGFRIRVGFTRIRPSRKTGSRCDLQEKNIGSGYDLRENTGSVLIKKTRIRIRILFNFYLIELNFSSFLSTKSQYSWYFNIVLSLFRIWIRQSFKNRIWIRPWFENRFQPRSFFKNRIRIRPHFKTGSESDLISKLDPDPTKTPGFVALKKLSFLYRVTLEMKGNL